MTIEDEKYNSAIETLYACPAFQSIGSKAYKPGLENITRLSQLMGNPHKALKCIHIGGTNGKGSTASTIAAILAQAGYKTGLYTSPHLLDFRERIKVNGEMISKEAVIDFMNRYGEIDTGDYKPSFFELTTLMAFDYFRICGVDIAVIEVGLGGRYDSTNIISPELAIITNISLDHMAILGNTTEKIAQEKAGIIKPGTPVVIGNAHGEIRKIFAGKASELNSPITFAQDNKYFISSTKENNGWKYTGTSFGTIHAELGGNCQPENTATILAALDILKHKFTKINDNAVGKGFANVCALTGLQGRWMEIDKFKQRIICDTGHNVGGWEYLGPALQEIALENTLHMVLGFVNDKDISSIIEKMPRKAKFYFATPSVERGRDSASTAEFFAEKGISGSAYCNVNQAFNAAIKSAAPYDTIFVGGSTFIVADFLESINKKS